MVIGWVGQVSAGRYFGEEVEFAISGYDPRDLLSGHYLTYRVDFGGDWKCSNELQYVPSCLCLEKDSSGKAKAISQQPCDDTTCPLFLKGDCRYGTFEAGIERFYFAEQHQKALAIVPPKASIKVKISSSGTGYVQELLVDNVPLSQWLKSQK